MVPALALVLLTAVRFAGEVAVVSASPTNFPFDRPFDLENRTITFTPEGSGYHVENGTLAWDDDRGSVLEVFTTPAETHRMPLTRFAFPFAGSPRTSLVFDGVGGIRFDEPQIVRSAQVYDVNIAGIDEPLISPLLRSGRTNPSLTLRVRETSDYVLATWTEGAIYEVQARLRANGTISFSYKSASPATNGAVVVTPGAAAWRQQREVLSSASGVEVSRIAASDILEVRVSGPRKERYDIDIGEPGVNSGIRVVVSGTTVEYRSGNWTRIPVGAPAVVFEGDTLVVRVSDEMIRWRDGQNRGTVTRRAATDFSVNRTHGAGPIFETFTRGYLDTYAVWDEVRTALAVRDQDVDGVAISTELITDLYALGGLAYSTVGNAGASGVMLQVADHDPVGPQHPARPALLLLGSPALNPPLLLHELGHRWLLHLQFDRGQGPSLDLNSDFHPTPLVQAASAFPALAGETSCMGGTSFTETAPGVFVAPPRVRSCGYSWLDLYLMGLASPEEVPPFFYLTNPDRLVNVAFSGEVRATKEVVTVADVIRGMGPRFPSAATSRKTFRVVYVLVESASEPATQPQLDTIDALRVAAEQEFARATGNRGAIDSRIVRPVRRRTVR